MQSYYQLNCNTKKNQQKKKNLNLFYLLGLMLRVRLHNQLHLDTNQTEKSRTVKVNSLEFKPMKKKNKHKNDQQKPFYKLQQRSLPVLRHVSWPEQLPFHLQEVE